MLIPSDLNSFIALFNFFLFSKPESFGMIKTFLSSISSKANCKEYKREFPNSLNSPVKGASKPTLRTSFCSLLKRLKLKKRAT